MKRYILNEAAFSPPADTFKISPSGRSIAIQREEDITVEGWRDRTVLSPFTDYAWFLYDNTEMLVLRQNNIIFIADEKTKPSPLMKLSSFDGIKIHSYKDVFVVVVIIKDVVEPYIFHKLRQTRKKGIPRSICVTFNFNCLLVLREGGEVVCIDCRQEGKEIAFHVDLTEMGMKREDLANVLGIEVSDNLNSFWIIKETCITRVSMASVPSVREYAFDQEMEELYESREIKEPIVEDDFDDVEEDEYVAYKVSQYIQDYVDLCKLSSTIETFAVKHVVEIDCRNCVVKTLVDDMSQLVDLKSMSSNDRFISEKKTNVLYLFGTGFCWGVVEDNLTVLYLRSDIDIAKAILVCEFDAMLKVLQSMNNVEVNYTLKLMSVISHGKSEDVVECFSKASPHELWQSVDIVNTFIEGNDSLNYVVENALEAGMYIIQMLFKNNKSVIFNEKYQDFCRRVIDMKCPVWKKYLKEGEKYVDKDLVVLHQCAIDMESRNKAIDYLYTHTVDESIHLALRSGIIDLIFFYQMLGHSTCNSRLMKNSFECLLKCGVHLDNNLLRYGDHVKMRSSYESEGFDLNQAKRESMRIHKELEDKHNLENLEKEKSRTLKQNELEKVIERKNELLEELKLMREEKEKVHQTISSNPFDESAAPLQTNIINNETIEYMKEKELKDIEDTISSFQYDIGEITNTICPFPSLEIFIPEIVEEKNAFICDPLELICPLEITDKESQKEILEENGALEKDEKYSEMHFPKHQLVSKEITYFFTPVTHVNCLPLYEIYHDTTSPCNQWMLNADELLTQDFSYEDIERKESALTQCPYKEIVEDIKLLYQINNTYTPTHRYGVSTQRIQSLEWHEFPLKECLMFGDVVFPLLHINTTNESDKERCLKIVESETKANTIFIDEMVKTKSAMRMNQFKSNHFDKNSTFEEIDTFGFFNREKLNADFFNVFIENKKLTVIDLLTFCDHHKVTLPLFLNEAKASDKKKVLNNQMNEMKHVETAFGHSKKYPSLLEFWSSVPLEEYLSDFTILKSMSSIQVLKKIPARILCEMVLFCENGAVEQAEVRREQLHELINEDVDLPRQIENVLTEYSQVSDVETLSTLSKVLEKSRYFRKISANFRAISLLLRCGVPRKNMSNDTEILHELMKAKVPYFDEFVLFCSEEEQFQTYIIRSLNRLDTSKSTLNAYNIVLETIKETLQTQPTHTKTNPIGFEKNIKESWECHIKNMNYFTGSKHHLVKHYKKCIEKVASHKECCVEHICAICKYLAEEIYKKTNELSDKFAIEKYTSQSFNECLNILGKKGLSEVKNVLRFMTNGQMSQDILAAPRENNKHVRMTIAVGKGGSNLSDLNNESHSNEEVELFKTIEKYTHTCTRLRVVSDIINAFPVRRDILDLLSLNYSQAIKKILFQFLKKDFLEMLDNTERWEMLFKSLRTLKQIENIPDEDIVLLVVDVIYKGTTQINLVKTHGWSNQLVSEIVGMFCDDKVIGNEVLRRLDDKITGKSLLEILNFVVYSGNQSRDVELIQKALQICYENITAFLTEQTCDLIRFLSRTLTFNDMYLNDTDVYTYLVRKVIQGEVSFKQIIPNNDSKLTPVNVIFFTDVMNQVISETPLNTLLYNDSDIIDCFMYVKEFEQAAYFQYSLGEQCLELTSKEIEDNMCFPENVFEKLFVIVKSFSGAMSLFMTVGNSVWTKKCSQHILEVILQIIFDNVQIIGLGNDIFMVSGMLCYFNSFDDANMFAWAYHIDETCKWASALYQQCVVMGNLQYLRDWAECYDMDKKTLGCLEEIKGRSKKFLERWEVFYDLVESLWPFVVSMRYEEKVIVEKVRSSRHKLTFNFNVK